jgi:hypothetical protein
MSEKNEKESFPEKLKRWEEERKVRDLTRNTEDIPKSSQRISIIIHVFFIAIFILLALTNMHNNWRQLFMCFYLTVALIWMANKYKDRTHVTTNKATRVILMATLAGLALGFFTYYTPIGESLQQKQLDAFFENNKALVGQEYYDMYIKNKDNMDELKILRKRIHDDLAI